jgi:hypothetical protein
VEACGFIKHPTIKWVGVSPDGLIDDDGGFESKSPFNSVNHLYTLLDGMPEEHMAQCQGGMWVTGRASGGTSNRSIRGCRKAAPLYVARAAGRRLHRHARERSNRLHR